MLARRYRFSAASVAAFSNRNFHGNYQLRKRICARAQSQRVSRQFTLSGQKGIYSGYINFIQIFKQTQKNSLILFRRAKRFRQRQVQGNWARNFDGSKVISNFLTTFPFPSKTQRLGKTAASCCLRNAAPSADSYSRRAKT